MVLKRGSTLNITENMGEHEKIDYIAPAIMIRFPLAGTIFNIYSFWMLLHTLINAFIIVARIAFEEKPNEMRLKALDARLVSRVSRHAGLRTERAFLPE